MKNLNLVLGFLCFLFSASTALATHNKAGEIEFKQTNSKTIEASIVTYTKLSSLPADRDSLTLCWGDGLCERLVRVNGPIGPDGIGAGEVIGADTRKNIYTAIHLYSEVGTYTLSMTDPNRNGGIVNVNFPNSDQIPFHVQANVQVLDNNWENNHSPTFLENPIDMGAVGQTFVHVPNAFDTDDDSVVYSLIIPMSGVDEDVPNYQFPDMVNPGPNNNLSIDPNTGMLTWESPQRAGEYNVAIRVQSFRNGALWDEIIRDMQITVVESNNIPPTFELTETNTGIIEVQVGDFISVGLTAGGIQNLQLIDITSSSGLYDFFENPASFSAEVILNTGTGQFEWEVLEEHVRQQPYLVVFKVKDTMNADGLAAFKVLQYKVATQLSNTTEVSSPEFNIFPNPASEVLRLTFDTYPGVLPYRITDAMGREISKGMVQNAYEEINLQGLSPGGYILQVGNRVQKFLINR
jgi:hypothetical protein